MFSQEFRTNTKLFLKKYLPEKVFKKIHHFFLINFSKYFNYSEIEQKYTKVFLAKYNHKVIEGPFAEMQYVKTSVGSSFLHKLAGYYEAILHPFIYEISKKEIKNILDIGSAEGYYTTGFARIFRDAEIVAFEMEELGRKLTKEMHTKNNLKNKIQIFAKADNENIVEFIKPKTLLICDCEGAEKELFNNIPKSILENISYGIIELHDEFVSGCKDAIFKNFENTHNIEIIKFKFANPEDFSFLKSIENKNDLSILQKERGIQDQEWAILRNKTL